MVNRRSITSQASAWLRHHDKQRKKPNKNIRAAKFKRWQNRQQKTGAASPVRHIDPDTWQP
jgi:hypothetical protein